MVKWFKVMIRPMLRSFGESNTSSKENVIWATEMADIATHYPDNWAQSVEFTHNHIYLHFSQEVSDEVFYIIAGKAQSHFRSECGMVKREVNNIIVTFPKSPKE